jgi:PKD repeat protein
LADYINGIKSATIKANYDGASTTVTVTNTKPISGFTIKAGVGNVKSATCSNAAVTTKTDILTGATYIIADLAAGSHTFTITSNTTSVSPVAKFTSNVTQGPAPLAVLFNDTSKNASVWKWDFGDGTNSTERNTTHVYTAVGNFTVNLTASNAIGSNSSLAPINVTGINSFPNCTNPPTDLNNDKLYEDINGNRQLDFDDVVAYFDNIGWIRQKGLITNFDFDNSSSIDYNDVVKLYGMI